MKNLTDLCELEFERVIEFLEINKSLIEKRQIILDKSMDPYSDFLSYQIKSSWVVDDAYLTVRVKDE
jgi:hypothetical protein